MNDKEDSLIRIFRERLKGYKQPVKKNVWTDIERDLQVYFPGRNRLIPVWAGLAASVLFIIALSLFFQPEKKIPVTTITSVSNQLQKKELLAELIEQKVKPSKKTGTLENRPPMTDEVSTGESASSSLQQRNQPVDSVASHPETATSSDSKETVNQPVSKDTERWVSPSTKKKRDRNIAYALAIGNSGSAPESNGNNANGTPYFDLSGKIFGNSLYNGLAPANAEAQNALNTQYDFDLPVSVSFSVRKYLTDNWALESGLKYTFLSSRETSSIPNKGLQTSDVKLNYIGIPIQAVYSFYNSDRLSVYLSTGGMVEKNVYGKTTATTNNESTTQKIDIPELQWSVFGHVGLNYRLVKNLGLFVEPGVGYYFDDQSDVMTIRKDSPFNFNIQGGIRLTY